MSEETLVEDPLAPMSFSLDLIEIPLTVGSTEYVIREASGHAAVEWRDAIISQAVLGESGKAKSIGKVAGSEPLLVSLCVFKASNKSPISKSEVLKWPAKIIKSIFEKIKEINDLDEEEDETPETLRKQIEELTTKLRKLEGGDDEGND